MTTEILVSNWKSLSEPSYLIPDATFDDWMSSTVQEVFHVYLNTFENAVTHLFLVILGNN